MEGASEEVTMETHSYGSSVYHTVDVYGNGPNLLLFVHGGLYVDGDKGEHKQLASLLATSDWRVAVPNYRLSGAKSTDCVVAPAHTHDLAAAVTFLLAKYRPLQWAVIGHSCGAHMAMLALVNPQFRFFPPQSVPPAPTAFVGVQGMYDNRLFCADFPDWVGELRQSHDMETWFDPTRELPSDVVSLRHVRFHLIHAPADRYVNEAQPRAMMTALQGWGISSCTLEGGPGEHFDGVRGALVPWLAGVLIPLLRASLDTLDGADERRRMEAAGFREGLEAGETHALQQSFNAGFSAEAPYWLELGRVYGALRHAALMDRSLQPVLDKWMPTINDAIASGKQVDLTSMRETCAQHRIALEEKK